MANTKLIAPDFAAIEAAGLPSMGAAYFAWKVVPREGGKRSKVPYGLTGAISSQKPEQWVTYEEAKALYQGGGFSGVGYLNQPSDSVVCLDADGVLDPDGTVLCTGLKIVAQLEALGCYLERSPSGLGLRGFIRGTKGGASKARTTVDGHSVEVYQTSEDAGGEAGQYVTITGAHYGKLKPVDVWSVVQWRLDRFLKWAGLTKKPVGDGGPVERTVVMDWKRRDDAEVIRLILDKLSLKGKLNRLWSGDVISEYGGDQSAGRYALLKALAVVTRNAEQIECIVKQSKLDPSRFDEKRGNSTKLKGEIAKALNSQLRNFDIEAAERRKDRKKARGNDKALALALRMKAAKFLMVVRP